MRNNLCHLGAIFCILVHFTGSFAQADENLIIRTHLEQAQSESSSAIINTEAVQLLYIANHFQPLWFGKGPLSDQKKALLEAIESSTDHGFQLSRYHFSQLTQKHLPNEVQDILFTDALFSQIQHRSSGVVNRKDIDRNQGNWFIEHSIKPPEDIVTAIINKPKTLTKKLQNLWPEHPDYWALIKKRSELSSLLENNQPALKFNRLLKPKESSEEIVKLKQYLWGTEETNPIYDQQLEKDIRRRQLEAGLEPDGIVGPDTLSAINFMPKNHIDQIDANLERWRWLPREMPNNLIRVNIASFQLKAYQDKSQILVMDIIVGRPYRQTPVFSETLKYMVLNPYWNVPWSIAVKDKLPLLKANPDLLVQSGYQVKLTGSPNFISVAEVDWQSIKAGQFTLRQLPGKKNALGKIKFMMPNPFDIYLHDTSDTQLFGKKERLFSSGCIRVSQPRELAQWLLSRENNSSANNLNSLYDSSETTVIHLSNPVPVYIVYLTAFTDDNGTVVFRQDRYARDQPIIHALHNFSTQ